uniref:Uncharacterized protein n=1 Tax=Canis lupus dingo TaxID=286419 RepID=A0A8C0K888_CANLU
LIYIVKKYGPQKKNTVPLTREFADKLNEQKVVQLEIKQASIKQMRCGKKEKYHYLPLSFLSCSKSQV